MDGSAADISGGRSTSAAVVKDRPGSGWPPASAEGDAEGDDDEGGTGDEVGSGEADGEVTGAPQPATAAASSSPGSADTGRRRRGSRVTAGS